MEEQDALKLDIGTVADTPPGDDPVAGWSAEDQAWFAQLPELHQITARRHGRVLWSLSMNAGVVGHALGIILRQSRGNRAVLQAVQTLQVVLNELIKGCLRPNGLTPKHVQECQGDIERAASLATAGGQKGAAGAAVSKGGIILNS